MRSVRAFRFALVCLVGLLPVEVYAGYSCGENPPVAGPDIPVCCEPTDIESAPREPDLFFLRRDTENYWDLIRSVYNPVTGRYFSSSYGMGKRLDVIYSHRVLIDGGQIECGVLYLYSNFKQLNLIVMPTRDRMTGKCVAADHSKPITDYRCRLADTTRAP